MAKDNAPFLDVDGLVTGYGNKQVVNGASVYVSPGEIVALIGHNGAGKSTLLKALFGLLPIWNGRVLVDGDIVNKLTPHKCLSIGIAYVPQGNRVFSDLTVDENLEMSGAVCKHKAQLKLGIERVLSLFPLLETRLRQRAGTLSGGEKQMLALAMVLVPSPRALLLDEPSLGLAPQLAGTALNQIATLSRESGVSVLIVEQKVREVLKIANRVYVLRNGVVSYGGPAATLTDDTALRRVYM